MIFIFKSNSPVDSNELTLSTCPRTTINSNAVTSFWRFVSESKVPYTFWSRFCDVGLLRLTWMSSMVRGMGSWMHTRLINEWRGWYDVWRHECTFTSSMNDVDGTWYDVMNAHAIDSSMNDVDGTRHEVMNARTPLQWIRSRIRGMTSWMHARLVIDPSDMYMACQEFKCLIVSDTSATL